MARTADLTPMLRHYLELKARYPDGLLFYRLGDFYELFFEDARIAARELELTLTARHRGTDHEAPMCGVPHHAFESYAGRLLKRGYKVVLCDQVEDASQARGPVRREVTRVLSPGTLTEAAFLEGREATSLGALEFDAAGQGGAAFLEVSTGRLLLVRLTSPLEALEQLALERPAELLAGSLEAVPEVRDWVEREVACRSVPPDPARHWKTAHESLCRQFGVASLRGFGLEPEEPAVRAGAAVLAYARENLQADLSHVQSFELAERHRYLQLDATALAHLEVFRNQREGGRSGTLLAAVDRTVTAAGGRLLEQWLRRPLLDSAEVRQRQEAVRELLEAPGDRERLRRLLGGLPDLERLGARAAVGALGPREAASLRRGLQLAAEVTQLGAHWRSELLRESSQLEPLQELRQRLEEVLEEEPADDLASGSIIRAGIDAELDETRSLARDGQRHLLALEARERELTGIPTLKLRHHRSFGYSFEVSRPHLTRVPERFLRRQTLTQGERFVTAELLELADRIVRADSQRQDLERRHFEQLRQQIAARAVEIGRLGRALAGLDVLAGWAELAEQRAWVAPHLEEPGSGIEIRDGRHPVLEQVLGRSFVPNDCVMDPDREGIVILTGPNMGGKSTFLRQLALLVILAQAGCYVPARSARLGLVDRIFSRVGASDDLARGESTFMVEMIETARILRQAGPHSLVILDEVGRGTSTFDGLSLAWSIVEYLHEHNRSLALFATHYHELTELAEILPRVRNWTVAVREIEGRVIFLHKILEGAADRSYGLHVAQLAGVPRQVVDRARELLARLEGEQWDALGRPKLAGGSPGVREVPLQLPLFCSEEEQVVELLRSTDLERLTPLAALNLLASLQAKLGVPPAARAAPPTDRAG